MHYLLEQGLAERGMGISGLPSDVELVVGLLAATKRLGASRVLEIQATSKYNKRVKRSSWAPYVIPDGDGYVVTCPDPADLPKNGWRALPAIEAALDHVAYLAEHGKPWQPPQPIFSVDEFEVPPGGIVAVDIEGQQGIVDRLGLATERQTLTCQWDIKARHLVHELALNKKIELVAHNAPFDSCGLSAETGDLIKPLCTMVATRLVNPWRRVGLGHSAPLYVPGLSPWKHMEGSDVETYNAIDAAVLVPMWARLKAYVDQRHMERAYAEDLIAEYAVFDWQTAHEDRLQFSVNWTETPVTKAAGIIETKSQGGDGFSHMLYLESVTGDVIGKPIRYPEDLDDLRLDILDRHILGYGPRQIRNGGKEYPNGVIGLPDNCKDKCIKEITDAFDALNPAFVSWRDRLNRQAAKDKYVTALDGRRFYGAQKGEAQRFVIFAEIGRRLKRTLPYDPQAINHQCVMSDHASPEILEALRG